MIDERTREELLASDRASVTVAARRLGATARTLTSADERATLLANAVQVLDGARELNGRERDARTRSVLEVFRGDRDVLSRFAMGARHDDAAVRNAVRASLPADLRGEYGTWSTAGAQPPPASPPPPTPPERAPKVPDTTSRVVLLLGSESEHAASRHLVVTHGFSVILRDRPDDLAAMAASACGVVVGSSFWASLAPESHMDMLQQICELSSITFLRIDTNRLESSAAAALGDILRRAHAAEPHGLRVRPAAGCTLTESELPELTRAGTLIESADNVRLHPAGLSTAQETLLRAAALCRIHTETGSAVSLERIVVRFLDGGRSPACLAILDPDDGGAPFVAKLDDPNRLRNEMERYRRYIARWEARTQPELHFHGGCAAIVFSLVDDASNGSRPAPMLESRMEMVLSEDLTGTDSTLAEHVATAVGRAVERLANLNGRRVAEDPQPIVGWMAGATEFHALAQRGIVWDLKGRDGSLIDMVRLAEAAAARVDCLDGLARSHGDVHLRNILLRDDREPFFIDYAYSGGLHPCYDLVRLDVALSHYVLGLQGEQELTEIFHALIVDGASMESLAAAHPLATRPRANCIAFTTTAQVRQACLALLETYGGDVRDYFAMQGVITSFALRRAHLQNGAIRARLSAIGPVLVT